MGAIPSFSVEFVKKSRAVLEGVASSNIGTKILFTRLLYDFSTTMCQALFQVL